MVTSYKPALYRGIALILIAGGWFLLQQEAVRVFLNTTWEKAAFGINSAYEGTGNGLAWIGEQVVAALSWTFSNFGPILIMISIGLLALALRFSNHLTWFAFGATAIWTVFYNMPHGFDRWTPEMLQCIIIYGLIIVHIFKAVDGTKAGCYVLAFMVVFLGLIRFLTNPSYFAGSLIFAEFLLLIGGGIYLKYTGYVVIGLAQALAVFIFNFEYFKQYLNTGGFFLGTALALFAVGIFVTFNKRSIIDRLDRYNDWTGPDEFNGNGKIEITLPEDPKQ
jgi:hypothetical protein